MAIEYANLSTSDTDVITVPGGSRYALTTVIVCNHAGSSSTSFDSAVTIHLVKDGDTKGTDNIILNTVGVPAQDTFTFSVEKIILNEGDKLVAFAAANDRLSAIVSYLEV